MLSKRHLAQHYRSSTIDLLGRMGYATTRQVARAIWGRVTASTRKMANRTISGLRDQGFVTEKRDENSVSDERLVALTAKGTVKGGYTLPKGRADARDWLRHAHLHRTMANSVYVAAASDPVDGSSATELEVRSGLAPDNLGSFRWQDDDGVSQEKIPDGVIATEAGYVWIEVENAYRSIKDFTKVISWMRAMFKLAKPPVVAVWFVITSPGAATIGRRLAAALGPGDPHTDGRHRPLRELDARILANHVRVFELDHERLELMPVAGSCAP